jgi:hypothetical protein
MDRLRLLYTTVLACLLILSGCFGATVDQGESQTPGSTSPTIVSPPIIEIIDGQWEVEPIIGFDSVTGAEEITGYWSHIYHAMLDVDGTIASAGWDIDLDGTIDYPTTANKAFTNITIPVSEWISPPDNSYALITSVAFIATDNDGWISADMLSLVYSPSSSQQQNGPDLYQYRASNHNDSPGAGTSDNLMVLEFMQAPADLNWVDVRVQIIGDDGVPHTCKTDGSTDCTITQYGSDDTFWEKSEVLHLSENGADLCTGGQCAFSMKISVAGDSGSWYDIAGTGTVIVE